MALAVEQSWPSGAPLSGLVVTRYGHGQLTNRIKVVEAGHPMPDESGANAAREMLRLAGGLGKEDLLLALVSGGGSSLLSLPAPGLTLEDLRSMTRALLRCGAPVQDVNTVRKHLSAILGGRLAAASRAPVHALVISDVTGDDPSHVASGPCSPDPGTFADAFAILTRHAIDPGPIVRNHLERGLRGDIGETPKPGDAMFKRVSAQVIASSRTALQAAAVFFAQHGVTPVILGDSVTGEAREVARPYGALAREIGKYGLPWKTPVALISGGECTVTVAASHAEAHRQGPATQKEGRGGRCSEFLLSLAMNLSGDSKTWALACDTDGIDGTEDNAGAILTPDTLARAASLGVGAEACLAAHDAWSFFDALGDLVVTGPTQTNVNDYRVILVT